MRTLIIQKRDPTMPEQVPSFDDESVARLVGDLYGIEGEITPLVSFEDHHAGTT